MKITQSAFAEELAVKAGLTASDTRRVVDIFKELVYTHVASGNTVELSGFGQFMVKHRKERQGVNPRTLEKMTVPAFNAPKFKAGQAFKEAVALNK